MTTTYPKSWTCKKVQFPSSHTAARRRALQRLYERKETLEALIQSLEDYARCRSFAEVTTMPLGRQCG